MGWDSASNWTKKADVVNETVSEYTRAGFTIHAKASTTQGLYLAVTCPNSIVGQAGKRIILAFMIEKRGGDLFRKSMSEASGPAMDDCPLKLLNMIPDPNEGYSTQWRLGVVQAHQNKKRDLMGKRISLGTNHTYLITGRQGRCYLIERQDGKLFRLSKRQELSCTVLPDDLRTIVKRTNLEHPEAQNEPA